MSLQTAVHGLFAAVSAHRYAHAFAAYASFDCSGKLSVDKRHVYISDAYTYAKPRADTVASIWNSILIPHGRDQVRIKGEFAGTILSNVLRFPYSKQCFSNWFRFVSFTWGNPFRRA